MSYTAEISRTNPSCIIFLIDQSYSMTDKMGGGTDSKADELARAINRILQELIIKCSSGEEIRRYFQIGVIGYGNKVGPALGGALQGKPLVWVDELYQNPLRVDEITRKVPDGAGGLVDASFKLPIWFDAVADNGTPMCQALSQVLQLTKDWVQAHPDSYPPIVINFTDGESTDGDPLPLAKQLMDLTTNDGNTLMLNLHLSSSKTRDISFPDGEDALPDRYSKMLFKMSSVLPASMGESAAQFGYKVSGDSHGFVFNAALEDVIQFLNIGTRPSNLR